MTADRISVAVMAAGGAKGLRVPTLSDELKQLDQVLYEEPVELDPETAELRRALGMRT